VRIPAPRLFHSRAERSETGTIAREKKKAVKKRT
jgi:hypothetical protein